LYGSRGWVMRSSFLDCNLARILDVDALYVPAILSSDHPEAP